MGPGRYQTRDPGSAVRRVTDCAMWPGKRNNQMWRLAKPVKQANFKNLCPPSLNVCLLIYELS